MTIESKHGLDADGEPPTEVHEPSLGDGDGFWARLKRALWGSTPRRIVSGVVGLLVVLIVAGGIADALNGGSRAPVTVVGTNAPSTPETNGTTTPETNGFSGDGCTSGPADANVRVTIYGGETCAQWDRTQSASGTFWRETSFPTSNDEQLVCSMEGPGGRTLIEVRDTGEHFYGNKICALLTAENWHNAEGPGAKLERTRKAHEAQEQYEHEQQRDREAQQQREAEKPKLEREAAKLRAEAASLRQTQHHEEALKADDDREASNLIAEAKRVEGEEPSDGGGKKDTEGGEIESRAGDYESNAGDHESNADSAKSEAETKESEAKADETKASED